MDPKKFSMPQGLEHIPMFDRPRKKFINTDRHLIAAGEQAAFNSDPKNLRVSSVEEYLKNMGPIAAEYMLQTAGHNKSKIRGLSDRAMKELHPEGDPDIQRALQSFNKTKRALTLQTAFSWGKKLIKTAWNYQVENGSGDPVIEQIFQAAFEAFTISMRKCKVQNKKMDLVMTEYLEMMYEKGLMYQFPDNAEELLESIILAHPYRFEFFDAYYFLQKEAGRLDKVLKFLEKNPHLLSTIADDYSEALEELMGEHLVENGTPFRLEKLKLKYLGNPNDLRAYSYIVQYLLKYKSDYEEARKITRTVKNPALKAALKEEISQLIPSMSGNKALGNFGLNENETEDLKIDRELGEPTGPMAERDIKKQQEEIRVATVMQILGTETSLEEKIKALKELQKLKVQVEYFLIALNLFSGGYIDLEKDPNLVIKAIQAVFDSGLALPEEVFSIYAARLTEAYYQTGDYRKATKAAQIAPITEAQRGSTYYLAKSCFALADEGGAESDGFRKTGIQAAIKVLPKLRGTEWEKDLWENHLLEEYGKNPEPFGEIPKVAFSIAERLAFEDPDGIDLEKTLIFLKIAQLQRTFNQNVLVALSTAQVQVSVAGLPEENPLSRELLAMSMDLLQHFKEQGKYQEVLIVIGCIPNYEQNPDLVREQVLALIHPSNLTQEHYETALEAIEPFEDLQKELNPKLEKARQALGIEKINETSPQEFLKSLIEKEIAEGLVCNDDNVRIAFILNKLKDIIEGYAPYLEEKIGEENCFQDEGFIEHLDLANNELAKRLGIKSIRFQKRNENIEAVVILDNPEKEDQSTLETITFTFDKNFRLEIPDLSEINLGPENIINKQVILKTLESLILEELYNALEQESCEEVTFTTSEITSLIATYRSQVAKLIAQTPSLKEYAGLEGIEERNTNLIAQIDSIVEEHNLDLVPDEECISLITRYLDLIRNCRDLDDPIRTYKSPIDRQFPISKAIKYLEIFNPEFAHLYLTEECDLETEDLEQFGIPKTERNSFTGYYELNCFIPDEGEKTLSIFLDEDGIAHIPGIDKDHPYYKQLWMLTLESLATKVVPELGPYTHFFRERKPRQGGKQIGIPKTYGTSEITTKKRICCARIVRAHTPDQEKTTEEQKLRVLDDITQIFNTLELAERNIEDWKLIVKKDGEYQRIKELFFFNEKKGANYVDLDKLCEIFNISMERFGDQKTMPVIELPTDIQTILQKEIRIQTLGGRRMNLGITWRPLPETLNKDEQGEYELKEASYRRGDVIEIDGKLYRKKRIKPNVKVAIGSQTFLAIPDQMSEQSMRRYEEAEDIGIPLSFDPEENIYAVIYDPVKDKIVSYKYIGSSRKDEEGKLVDKNSRRAMNKHERGLPVYADSAKVREELGDRDDLTEVLFEITTNKGFMYGKSYPVWKYLESTSKREDAAGRMLLDLMKKKLSSAEYKQFLEELEAQKVEEKKQAPKKPAKKRGRKPQKSQWERPVEPPKEGELHVHQRERRKQRQKHEATLGLDPNHPYTIKKSYRTSEISDNLWDEDLWYIPPEHPIHKAFLDSLEPKEDEVIVARKVKNGSPLKIKKDALEPKL